MKALLALHSVDGSVSQHWRLQARHCSRPQLSLPSRVLVHITTYPICFGSRGCVHTSAVLHSPVCSLTTHIGGISLACRSNNFKSHFRTHSTKLERNVLTRNRTNNFTSTTTNWHNERNGFTAWVGRRCLRTVVLLSSTFSRLRTNDRNAERTWLSLREAAIITIVERFAVERPQDLLLGESFSPLRSRRLQVTDAVPAFRTMTRVTFGSLIRPMSDS